MEMLVIKNKWGKRMSNIILQILNIDGDLLQQSTGFTEVNLFYKNEYQMGNKIVLDREQQTTKRQMA